MRAFGVWVIFCVVLATNPCHAARPMAAGGTFHSYVLVQDGTVRAAGVNGFGELGDGTNTASSTFVTVSTANVHDIVQIAAGNGHGLALRRDGTVWAWGPNGSGQLGNGTTTNSNVPVQVTAPGFAGIVAIAASGSSSYAIDGAGRVWVWGANFAGQLGDGTTTDRPTPAKLTGIASVVALAPASTSMLALVSDGTLRAWGGNSGGQLGNGNTTNQLQPVVSQPALTGVVRIAATNLAAYAVLADGSVWAWGSNGNHQLGDGTTTSSLTPVTVKTGAAANLGCVAEISGNEYGAVVTDCAGDVYVWGRPTQSACLGTSSTQYAYATRAVGLAGVAGAFGQVGDPSANGRTWTYTQNGSVVGGFRVCGYNGNGQLGTGDTTERSTPFLVASLAPGSKLGRRTNFRNSNSRADVFWRNADGTNIVWDYIGTSPTSYVTSVPPGVETTWTAIGTGDITGDAISDVVWFEPASGQVAIWIMGGPSTIASTTFPASVGAGSGWQIQGVGDMDGDSFADILWRNTSTGEVLVWYMKSNGTIDQAISYGVIPTSYQIRGLADVDGDWIKDIVWFQPSTGQVVLWKMNPGGSFTASFPASVGAGSGWDIYKVGDFDGDGREDLFWRRTDGSTAIWYLNGPRVATAQFLDGVPLADWSMQAIGDYDGDGREDVLWLSNSGGVLRWRMQGRFIDKVPESVVGVGSGWSSVQ